MNILADDLKDRCKVVDMMWLGSIDESFAVMLQTDNLAYVIFVKHDDEPTPYERFGLCSYAHDIGAMPVVAICDGAGRISYKDAKTGRRLYQLE